MNQAPGPQKRHTRRRRRLRNLLLKPRPQIELLLNVLAITIFFALACTMLIYFQLYDILEAFIRISFAEKEIVQDLSDQWSSALFWLLILIGVYVLAISAVCITHSHRMIGPFVAVQRQVESLLADRFHSRVRLRDGDYYQHLAYLLNRLSEKLEQRLGSGNLISSRGAHTSFHRAHTPPFHEEAKFRATDASQEAQQQAQIDPVLSSSPVVDDVERLDSQSGESSTQYFYTSSGVSGLIPESDAAPGFSNGVEQATSDDLFQNAQQDTQQDKKADASSAGAPLDKSNLVQSA